VKQLELTLKIPDHSFRKMFVGMVLTPQEKTNFAVLFKKINDYPFKYKKGK
jgi:hypothetical protein